MVMRNLTITRFTIIKINKGSELRTRFSAFKWRQCGEKNTVGKIEQ